MDRPRAQGEDQALERLARAWMEDPWGHFGHSATRAHSVDPAEAEAVQTLGVALRFAERRDRIPVLARLADAQGIRRIDRLDDAAPLLFQHTVYKSYPFSLLARGRFAELTRWLDRLTPVDLSAVAVADCATIDDWLGRLAASTPLDPAASSGSTGTLSLFPKTKEDYRIAVRGLRVQALQTFGREPGPGELSAKVHFLVPLFRGGHLSIGAFTRYNLEEFCGGDEAYLHTAFPGPVSADLMWLAARLRAAEARGDLAKLDVPEALRARLPELRALQEDMPRAQRAFVRQAAERLRGERVVAMGTTAMFHEVARAALAEGLERVFDPDSVVMGGGGAKGVELPADAEEVILRFTGARRLTSAYGMTELNTFSLLCEEGRYHFPPWLVVFLLDRDSGRPLPRRGEQTGRGAFFDLTNRGTWGGIVTGDRLTVSWEPCPCGRTTPHAARDIRRFSELEGGDDKITCAASPQAQAEALDFLSRL
ncbi:MAG: hypothetical protein KatS3mg124_0669 [Porticoccaceae bacterium]|nr:MAG: hypothetical protein KatS3mg124_0669 [Porticoccaceae bacterium]